MIPKSFFRQHLIHQTEYLIDAFVVRYTISESYIFFITT